MAVGWPGPPADHPDHAALITVRKQLGASDGVRMSAASLRSGGIVRITAAVDTAKNAAAVRGLLSGVERRRRSR